MHTPVDFLGNDGFVSQGSCLVWRLAPLWLFVPSDSFIVLAYYSLAITLFYFVIKCQESRLFTVFGLSIVARGRGASVFGDYNLDSPVLAGWRGQGGQRRSFGWYEMGR